MKIPFFSFDKMNEQIEPMASKALLESFQSGWYILGKQVEQFEAEYALLHNMDFCIGVASGLDALTISLKVGGIGVDDEVLVASNSYIASVIAISTVGATPIFVEPESTTFNIDPQLLKEKLTSRTKAIMPVHLFGQPCNMSEIMAFANEHDLLVVEDNAQSHLATWEGQVTGSFGQINATSFYPTKNLGALGDAGAITTNDEEFMVRCKSIRNYGFDRRYHCQYKGVNSRLDELQASILTVKLAHIQIWNEERRRMANLYNQGLGHIDELELPKIDPRAQSVYHLFVIQAERRDELQQFLRNKEIGTIVHYPIPPHLQTAYDDLGYNKGDFPIAESLAKHSLSLPIYIGLTDQEIGYICETISSFYNYHG